MSILASLSDPSWQDLGVFIGAILAGCAALCAAIFKTVIPYFQKSRGCGDGKKECGDHGMVVDHERRLTVIEKHDLGALAQVVSQQSAQIEKLANTVEKDHDLMVRTVTLLESQR